MRVTVKIQDYLWRPMTDSDDDTAYVVKIRSEPRYARMFFNSSISADGHKKFINSPSREDEINWMIERNGERLGMASMYHLDKAVRKMECGRTIMLDPKLFHMNYVISGHLAFEHIYLNKLYVETLEENTIIARGVERMGMTREGLFRGHALRDGKLVNVWSFGALWKEYIDHFQNHVERFGRPEVLAYDGWRADPATQIR